MFVNIARGNLKVYRELDYSTLAYAFVLVDVLIDPTFLPSYSPPHRGYIVFAISALFPKSRACKRIDPVESKLETFLGELFRPK